MVQRVAVIGAAGTQGSSVVRSLLKPPQNDTWTIRAITRTADSNAAHLLQGEGVDVVEADLDDGSSLRAAFANCQAVFAATDFFVPFAANGANAAAAIELEWRRATKIADAVSTSSSIEHFIWSTLPHAGRISNGKYHPAHFVAKNRLEDRIRREPNLLRRTTFLWVGWYATNFLYPVFAPTLLVSLFEPPSCFTCGTDVNRKLRQSTSSLALLAEMSPSLPLETPRRTLDSSSGQSCSSQRGRCTAEPWSLPLRKPA